MSGCLLRVNGLAITSVRLRPRGERGRFEIVIEDPTFGAFPLTRACAVEYLDLAIPKADRQADADRGWRRVTYDELVEIIQAIKSATET